MLAVLSLLQPECCLPSLLQGMLAHVQPGGHQDFQVLFCHAVFQVDSLWHVVVPAEVQGFVPCLPLVLMRLLCCGWQRCPAAPSSALLMEVWGRTGPSTDPWGIQLVTGLQPDLVTLITTLWTQMFSFWFTSLSAHPA